MKLKKQFSDFNTEITIDTEVEDLKEKREILQNDFTNNFPKECDEHDIVVNKSDIRVIDQGSYKLHTTIKNKYGSIDRDVAVIFPMDIIKNNDPRKIKGYGRDALITGTRKVTIKEPCINVSYTEDDKEWLHIDLPLYAQHNGSTYLARGREFSEKYSWETADPDGLNNYLLEQLGDNAQLRRIIKYLKKWKLEEYHDSSVDSEVPPSIGLTLLACDCFVACSESGSDDDLTCLQNTVQNIINKFSISKDLEGKITKAIITRYLPTVPYTDVFTRIHSSDTYGVKFYNKLDRALQNLKDACNEESEHDAGVSVQKVLGEEFVVPPKQASASNASSKKEHSFGRK